MSAIPFEIKCDERLRLLVEYQRVTAAYSAAVAELAVHGIPNRQYERLSANAEAARHASMAARENLEAAHQKSSLLVNTHLQSGRPSQTALILCRTTTGIFVPWKTTWVP